MSVPLSPSSEGSIDDLDLSILKQVKIAINRVADTQQDLDRRQEQALQSNESLSLDGLQAQCKECLEKISILEREVSLLDDEIHKRESPLENMPDKQIEEAILALADSPTPDGDQASCTDQTYPSDEGRSEVKLLKSRIALNTSLTGIRFKSVNWEITRTDEGGLFRKYDHIGTVHGFEFHIQFMVREEKDMDNSSPEPVFARIIGLKMKVDPRLEKELLPFITKLTTECDLMRLYQTYGKYCLCVKQRRKGLKATQALHGKCVQINAAGDRLHFSLPNGPTLNLMWDIKVSVDGTVKQSLSMQVKMLPNVCDEEREHFGRLQQLLQRMTQQYGYREAVFRTLNILDPPV